MQKLIDNKYNSKEILLRQMFLEVQWYASSTVLIWITQLEVRAALQEHHLVTK